ncbi:B12-binding domain-containing radical SAM protein [Paenibacillus piscarius]|uniref:B12-binding domain-containing radical SAM protein n=1 Tax=Paenibacillus piscarius TaxID=1089681 RepID=UPI001EE8906F|nr:radical SAM protein [Paenibacillus piscarius]
MKKKVVLIQPPFERLMGYARFYTHPGLLSLAGIIEAAGHDVLVYDADYDPNGISYDQLELIDNYDLYVNELNKFSSPVWDEVEALLREYQPDFVGITVLSVTQDSARKIAQISRDINPKVLIIAGGVHPTIFPEDVNFADYIVQNESEEVIVDIIEGKYGCGVISGKRIKDLDALPLPAVHRLYKLEKFKKRDLSLVMSTRGCPFSCKFCNSPQIWGRKVTRKSTGRFIEELQQLKEKHGVTDFYISDDSFTCNKAWLQEFCAEVKKLNVTWRCLDRIDHIREPMILQMMDAGCRNIKFGIESGSQRILDKVNKGIKVENVIKASELLERIGLNWSAFFMIGFPGETEEDIRMTQRMIQSISAKSVTLSIFTPFPGNELYEASEMDYKMYSHHSPYNNFTGVVEDSRFKELLIETIKYASKGYEEHTDRLVK